MVISSLNISSRCAGNTLPSPMNSSLKTRIHGAEDEEFRVADTELIASDNVSGRARNKRTECCGEAVGSEVGCRHPFRQSGPPDARGAVAVQQDLRVQLLHPGPAL